MSTTHNYYLLSAVTVLSLTTSFAGFANAAAFNSGFYVGAKAGVQEARTSWDNSSELLLENLNQRYAVALLEPDKDAESFQANFMGNVALGYAFVIKQRFFLAPELSVNLATDQEMNWEQNETFHANDTVGGTPPLGSVNDNLAINSEAKIRNPDIIFDLRPGFIFNNNFLVYGRIGTAFNQLSIEQEGSRTITDINENGGAGTFSVPIYSSATENVFAFRAGLGMEYKFTHNLAMNVDYVFTDYGHIDTTFSSGVISHLTNAGQILSETNVSSEADITKNTLTLGLNWYFGGPARPIYRGMDK